MTDTLGTDLGLPTRLPSRSTESPDRLARTDLDGPTYEESGYDREIISSNATRAGGQEYFDHDEKIHHHGSHVYVIYWPDIGVIKVGISENQDRWEWWTRRGAVTYALLGTDCDECSRGLERVLLGELAKVGARAFTSQEQARPVLGKHRGGYTECYRLVQSPRWGEIPEGIFDWERAHGLILPGAFTDLLAKADFVMFPIDEKFGDDGSAHSRRSA